jgi:hypothetical protein
MLASPAANIVPPIKFSLIKIAKIGCINPNPVKTKISETVSKIIVLFTTYSLILPEQKPISNLSNPKYALQKFSG